MTFTTPLRRTARFVQRRPLLVVAAVAAACRLAFATASFVLNPDVLIPDEAQYIDLAATVAGGGSAEDWFPDYGQSLYDATWVFMAPLRLLFDVFGTTRLVAQLWSVAWGVVAAVVVVLLGRRALPERWAIAAGLLVALLPSQVLWSSVVLRESMVTASLVVAALCAALLVTAPGRRAAVGAVGVALALAMVGLLRDQTMLAAALALPAAVVLAADRDRLARTGAALAVLVVVPWVSGAGPAGYDLVAANLPGLADRRATLATGADSGFVPTSVPPTTTTTATPPTTRPSGGPTPPVTATTAPPVTVPGEQLVEKPDGEIVVVPEGHSYVQAPSGEVYVYENDPQSNLRSVPRGTIAVLLRPFVWEGSTSVPLRLAAVENLAWYVVYGLVVLGAVEAWRRRERALAYPVLAAAAILAVAFVTQGNLGTSFRHRGQVLPLLAPIAALGAHVLVLRWRRWRSGDRSDELVDSEVAVA